MATAARGTRSDGIASTVDGGNRTEAGVLKFKRRMLEWPNPVEYVNNMYGCHPGDKNTEYFRTVFGE